METTSCFIEESEPKPYEEITRSTSKIVNIKGTHIFKIEGYSYIKGMGVGKYIASNTFSVGGHLWKIFFYPDGQQEDQSGDIYVSLFLALVSKCVKDLTFWYEFYLLDQNGSRWLRSNNTTFIKMEMNKLCKLGPCTVADNAGNGRGLIDYYKRSEFDASQFIKDDAFTIQCSIAVANTSMVPSNLAKPMPDLYERLLESKDGSDISFKVEGKTFYAHKIILSTKSPVFEAQFFGPLKNKKKCIKIKEMQAPVFKALLRYIYCDSLPDLKSDCIGMTQHLLAAADRYGIQTLKSLCESRLCGNIAIDNVASTLALADLHGCSQMKSKCLDFIRLPQNLEAVMRTVDPRI